jgi:hypothetical protein
VLDKALHFGMLELIHLGLHAAFGLSAVGCRYVSEQQTPFCQGDRGGLRVHESGGDAGHSAYD